METPVAEQQQLRAALDAALAATTDFGIRKLRDPRWQPAPDSEASAELASRQIRQDGLPWSEDVLRTPYALASLLMTGVLDNLGSIRQLISDPMPAIGPTVIARSAMEIGATAWWLMQPGIGARRRTCRQLALSLVSARRAAQVAQELRDDQSREEGLAQEDRVLAQIASLAISPPEGPRYRPVIEGESFPEATEITAAMLEPCYPALTGTRSFYRSYSAVLHGQLYGLMNFMTPAIQADGSILLSWQLRGSVLYGSVEVALLSFREPFKRINQHMGWGRLEYDLWHARAARALNIVTRRGAWHLQTAMSATWADGTGTELAQAPSAEMIQRYAERCV
jgi:hypothetical protein